MKNFKEFTNQYELSKTLRFELRAEPETKSLVEVIKKDKEIDQLYHKEMKPLFDDLHEKFINKALNKVNFSIKDLKRLGRFLKEYEESKKKLKGFNKDKTNNKEKIKKLEKIIKNLGDERSGEITKLQEKLRGVVVKQFNNLGEEWKKYYNDKGIKFKADDNKEKKGYEILTTKAVLSILKERFSEKNDAIAEFDKFFTYFSGFNINRKNYYTSDKKATGIANRIININLNIFIQNKSDFVLFLEKSKLEELREYEKNFELENFKNCLTQESIEEYNEIVGKVKKIINLEYNQKLTNKKEVLKGLNKLQKQIGCKTKQQREQIEKGESMYPKYLEKVGLGFHIIKNKNKNYQIWECLDFLNKLLDTKLKSLRKNYENFFTNWRDYNLDEIWFRREAINTISARWFGGSNWFVLTKALADLGIGSFDKKKDEYKVPAFMSLQELKDAMEALENKLEYKPENLFKDEYKETHKNKTLFEAFLSIWKYEIEFKFKELIDGYTNQDGKRMKSFLQNFVEQSQSPFNRKNTKHIKIVFNLMQNGYLPLLQMSKYHSLEKKGELVPGYSMEDKFYDALNEFWNWENFKGHPINVYRNALQATLTQKPYSENKIKLNFENASLAKGWDINKEGERKSVILRKFLGTKNQFGEKEYDYYLAVIDKNVEYPFDRSKNFKLYQIDKDGWEKMEYKYQKAAFLSIPKCSQTDKVKAHFKISNEDFLLKKGSTVGKFIKPLKISREIFELNNRVYKKDNLVLSKMGDDLSKEEKKKYIKKFQKEYLDLSKNRTAYKNALNQWIDFCKEFLQCYPSCEYFDYSSLQNTEKYNSVDEFYKDVDRLSYVKKFVSINSNELQKLVEEGEIYLFQIYNKDFSKKKVKKGGKDSLETLVLKSLFSQKNLDKQIIKLNGGAELFYRDKSIKKKKDKKRSKTFDIYKNKRYAEEKYFFHFPTTINFGAGNVKQKDFNQEIRKHILKNQKSIKIIGIDRGEKNLLYYSLIDSNGIVVKQRSLNIINNVNYAQKLQDKQEKRKEARLNWQEIGNIKNFKEGYLSQTIHEIYNLVIKHNAIVVMEDLNTEFKAKRGAKVEKTVYKKFELALAKKLNHLILKNRKPTEEGGVLKPYQLAPKIEKIDYFEKALQWGILFYVGPYYTSITDPLTGWRKHLYISNSAPEKSKKSRDDKKKKNTSTCIKEFFKPKLGVQIDYDNNKQCFKFSYEQDKKKWELFAFKGLQRFYWNNSDRKIETHDLHKQFKELFTGLDKSKNINQQICDTGFKKWKSLVFFWNLLNQIRNIDKSKTGNENDFLQSPVWSEKYQQFFDSRKNTAQNLPENGDANGAYNIARKGLILLKKIKDNPNTTNLTISNHEWDLAAQNWNKLTRAKGWKHFLDLIK